MQKIVREAYEFAKNWPDAGVVNDFIPSISGTDPNLLSVCLTDMRLTGFSDSMESRWR